MITNDFFLHADLRRSLISRMRKNHVLIVHQGIKEFIVVNPCDSSKSQVVKVVMDIDPKRPNVQRVFSVDLVVYSGGRDANSGILCPYTNYF
jgi:hypothetical protein